MTNPEQEPDHNEDDLSGKMFSPGEWDGGFLGAWYEDLRAEALIADAFDVDRKERGV